MRVRLNVRRGRLLTSLAASSAVALLMGTSGCDTKGFADPTELLRTSKDSLVLPIVSQVDPSVEEPETQWSSAQDPTAEDEKPSTADYAISRDDLLAITLSDIQGPNTETVKQARVTESGNISLPYLTQPVHAQGLTEIQLEQSIIDAYRTAGLIQNALVSVTVIEARGRAFSIFGAVAAPSEYAIVESDFRLLNALTLARNVTTPFVDYIYIVRRIEPPSTTTQPAVRPAPPTTTGPTIPPPTTGPSSDELAPPKTEADRAPEPVAAANAPASVVAEPVANVQTRAPEKVILAAQNVSAPADSFDGFRDPGPTPTTRVIRIPYDALKRGEMHYNIPVRPHDLIYVAEPQAGFYYVGGHVARPGAYQFTGQKVTVKDAIISASMLDGIAIPQRTDIIRTIRPDHEIFVRVDLEKIFAGEQPDIYLKPDDKVIVGTNAFAPFIAAARGAFRITYGFGFLYDKNYAYPNSTQGGIP